MVSGDFDIDGLADYLHLTPTQVAKLADRGKLPGRKVGGQWRFSRAEIHHWIEERIGILDDEELAQVTGALERSAAAAGEEPISLAELMPVEAIAVPLDARTRSSIITSMCQLAARTGLLWDAEKMAEAVRSREEMQPTALDNGVALLHPRRPMPTILSQPVLALGRTERPVPFAGNRGALTDIFFLICSTDDRTHLRVLARISRMLADAELLSGLRTAPDAPEIHGLIAAWEETHAG